MITFPWAKYESMILNAKSVEEIDEIIAELHQFEHQHPEAMLVPYALGMAYGARDFLLEEYSSN